MQLALPATGQQRNQQRRQGSAADLQAQLLGYSSCRMDCSMGAVSACDMRQGV